MDERELCVLSVAGWSGTTYSMCSVRNGTTAARVSALTSPGKQPIVDGPSFGSIPCTRAVTLLVIHLSPSG